MNKAVTAEMFGLMQLRQLGKAAVVIFGQPAHQGGKAGDLELRPRLTEK